MTDLPVLQTDRLRLRVLDNRSAEAVLDYYLRNRAFHQPWFASRSDDIFTIRQQQVNLTGEFNDFQAGRALPFWLSLQEAPDRIIGRFAFTNIVRGCFDSCFAAYHLDRDCQGAGLIYEAGQAAIKTLFEDYRMHRVEANIMPANQRSIALAERLGFKLEGLSPSYLKINGQWEDHLHYVRLADQATDRTPMFFFENGDFLIRPLQIEDIPAAMDYYQRNIDHLYAWNPAPALDLSTKAGWQSLFAAKRRELSAGSRLDFGIFLKDRPQWMAGTIECRAIKSLPWSSCELGFSIDRLLGGRGLMLETLSQVVAWLFTRYGLKRITASCVAEHDRSIKLLEMLGFQQEGRSKQALWLQDSWHDLIQMAILNEQLTANNEQF